MQTWRLKLSPSSKRRYEERLTNKKERMRLRDKQKRKRRNEPLKPQSSRRQRVESEEESHREERVLVNLDTLVILRHSPTLHEDPRRADGLHQGLGVDEGVGAEPEI